MRSMDMVMMVLLNAQERTEKEFEDLFKAADERFVFKVCFLFHSGCCLCACADVCSQGVTRADGCRMGVVEAVWQPEAINGAHE